MRSVPGRRIGTLALVALLGLALPACDDEPATAPATSVTSTTTTVPTTTSSTLPSFPGQEALAAARARWASRGLTRYRYRASAGSAWGASGPYDVYVDGDRVVEIAAGDSAMGIFIDRSPHDPLFGTVEYLFAVVESVPDTSLAVEYDPERGYPTRIDFDAPGCIDEEWGMTVESLEPYDGPIPTPAPLPEPDPDDLDLVRALYYVSGLVVARVVGPVDIAEGFCEKAWVVAVEVEQAVATGGPGSPSIEEGGRLLIQDGGGWGPRVLRGLEGARVLLPLYHEGERDPVYYLGGWAAVVSEQGLGSVGARSGLFDAELPLICRASFPGSTVDPSLGLPLLLAWADAMAGQGLAPDAARDHAAAAALEQACGLTLAATGA